jgi:hypothetical protein
VRLLAVVAVDADELVLIAPFVGVHVALGGGDHAEVIGPARGPDPGVDQRDRRLLGRRRLPRGAQAGDAGQQRERGRGSLAGRVLDQALADQLLDAGPADGVMALRPPGAEEVADEQLGIERTAHREQLPRRMQELVEQRVGGRDVSGLAVPSALRAHPDSLSDLDM